jgi:transposase
MLPPLELTEAECITFQELAEHHPYPDFRRRALGILALGKGHDFSLVAEILSVSPATPYNWLRTWNKQGLMGLLSGHQGGAPAKLTKELLDTAEQIARSSPCTLAQIEQRLREIHPDAPPFSLDRLSIHLKKRGLSFIRTRHSLKKNAAKPDSKRHKQISNAAKLQRVKES